jgi:hypothetical protein
LSAYNHLALNTCMCKTNSANRQLCADQHKEMP